MRHLVSISSLVAISTLLEVGLHATSTSAQSRGGPYRIDSAVIAAGGGTLSGGRFQLRGSFGQRVVGVTAASGYQLNGGFVGVDDRVFHNGFEYQ
jgi:hypothetical protein